MKPKTLVFADGVAQAGIVTALVVDWGADCGQWG